MTGRPVLITGASSGIGLATALAAARAGFATVATVRGHSAALVDAAASAGVKIDIVRLELADPRSISACVEGVIDRHGELYALVNNAGTAGSNDTLEINTMADLRATMETNFFGPVALSRAALPYLRRTRGRIITVGSVRGVRGQPFNEGYSAAKFAIEGLMEALAPVAAQVGVTLSLIEPAAVLDTEFGANAPGDPATVLATAGPYAPAFRAYRDWVGTGAIEGAQTSAEVAEVIVRALMEEKPDFRIPTSGYARGYVGGKLADPSGNALQAEMRSWVGEQGAGGQPTPNGLSTT